MRTYRFGTTASMPILWLIAVSSCATWAQSNPDAACKVDPPSFAASAPNIFNDQQEQDLGDALAEYVESDFRIAAPAADDQLTRIGERLLAALPPTSVHYRFRIYESGEVNGFSLAGGRVYISRKLVAAVKNEDELAGVLAHEIGHISTHQIAIEFSRILRIRLGVTKVTDRADIFAKIHQLLSTPANSAEEQNTEKKDQLAADRVAVYAMVRAGYATESFASFLNDSMVNKGKTGNWLSDMVGITHENSQRYRTALKLISTLPTGCKGRQAGVHPETRDAFLTWQRGIVEEHAKSVAQGTDGDQPLKLDAPLRPTMWRIRFSTDGRYILGQDEAGITVVDRLEAKVLFRIDAPDAEAAQFTPDGHSVVFHDSDLRVEQWAIATGKRDWVKEMVVFEGCSQTTLSPDGKTLVCVSVNVSDSLLTKIGVKLIDVQSGKPFYDKPGFYESSAFALPQTVYLMALEALSGLQVVSTLFSPDGHYLVISVANHTLSYDLEHRQPVALSGRLHDLHQSRMSFMGPDRFFLVGDFNGKGLYKAQVLSFPDGRVLKETQIGIQQVRSSSGGKLLVAEPLKDYAVALFDPDAGNFIAESKLPAIDGWEKWVALEDPTGGLVIGQMDGKQTLRVPLPLGPLPNPRSAQFSADGKYLAVSLRNRAEIWNLESGKQSGSVIRPFGSAWIDGTDHLFGQFPKYNDKEPIALKMAISSASSKELAKFEDNEWQYHDLRLHFKALGKDKSTWHHATLEVKKMETQEVVWTRDYPKETPACWPADDDRLVLAWDLTNDAAKIEMKNYPALQQEASAIKKRGLLLETVVPETGAPLQQVIIPESDVTYGRRDNRRATVSGDYVLARGEHGNTVIYRLSNGEKVGEFFGYAVSSDAAAGLIAAVNREDEILVVDEHTGKELKRFTLGSPVRLARIVADAKAQSKDRTLLVLTADQVVHRMPLSPQ